MNLVSVIIPVYNVEKFILKCLKSVYDQSYSTIEVILIDDCSPDNSIKLVEEYLKNNPNNFPTSIIQHDVNRGLSESRNTGINNANGDYIYFLDSDDWIHRNCIKLLVNSAIEFNSDVSIGGTICYLEKEKIEKIIFPLLNKVQSINTQNDVFNAFIQHQWPVIAPNKLYRLGFLEQHKLLFEPNLLGEDELWSFSWAQVAKRISFVNENTYYYLLREHSIISSKTKKNFEDMFFILRKFSDSFYEEKNPERKNLLKKHILYFKEMILIMQWRALSNERNYFYQNYNRLKEFPYLSMKELLFSTHYSKTVKKKSFLMHLPTFIGAPFFIKRYER